MNEKIRSEPAFHINEKYTQDYQQLMEIFNLLKSCGLTIPQYSDEIIQEQWDYGNTFPIANEGAQGIRISRRRRGGLTVSFTNGFENPKNPKRIEITERLREKGFDVV